MSKGNIYSGRATKKIVKNQNVKEISKDAVLYLAKLAEDFVKNIVQKTMPIVEHVHRKRILKKDLIFAIEEVA